MALAPASALGGVLAARSLGLLDADVRTPPRAAPAVRYTPTHHLPATDAEAQSLVERDLDCLAPRLQARVLTWEGECEAAGHPVRVWETCRSHDLAEIYYLLGRSKSPNGWRTWHFYGLAVDVVHPTRLWDAWTADDAGARAWRSTVVRLARAVGFDWGGDWRTFKDWPHFHFAECRDSPSDRAVSLYRQGGRQAVWDAVGAA